ncbi:hypothetical protein N0V93_002740 [Gnomoniopsis smithogilvyi]|uniref:Rhodopsin domain-containing protein n=1 Tax=Gnomoniopsis smithogilvyi TaxID=1191159 RepID=A0A9W8YY47_9PEZI|nr:hypothetical protein N0V93_002740 [Gnomoniopsis smithogilvyi]
MGWIFNRSDDTPTWGPQIVAISLTFTAVSFMTCCLRIYVRAFLIKAFGADDWAILCSWVGICGYAVTSIIQTRWGLGILKLDDMPTENIENFLLIQYIGSPFYVLCLFGFKFSLLMSYLRFIQFGFWNLATRIMVVVIVSAHIAFAFGFIFTCNPIPKSWDSSITSGSCLGMPFYTAFSALTIIFDIIIILLPFHVIISTQLQTRKKVAILGLFTLGIFITVVQVIRFSTIKSLSNLLDSARPITWSIIEGNLGIITTCIPTLAPLVRYYSEKSKLDGQSGKSSAARRYANGNDYNSSSYAMKSFMSGLRGAGTSADRNVVISGNHSGDSTERIYDTAGIVKTTELTVSSSEPVTR